MATPILRLRTPLEAYRATRRALERLTEKTLGEAELGAPGSYCAVGALYVSLTTPEGCAPEKCPNLNGWGTEAVIERLADSPTARNALKRIYRVNDSGFGESGAERYERMLAWLDEQIADFLE